MVGWSSSPWSHCSHCSHEAKDIDTVTTEVRDQASNIDENLPLTPLCSLKAGLNPVGLSVGLYMSVLSIYIYMFVHICIY